MQEMLLSKKKKDGPPMAGPDPFWNNVSLLLPWIDGFNDVSPRPKTPVQTGTVTRSTSGPYDTAGSVKMTGGSGFKITDGNGEFAFAAGVDFTTEVYVRITSRTSGQFLGQWASPNIYQFTLYGGYLGWEGVTVGKKAGTSAFGGPDLNLFTHCAMSRNNGTGRLFLGGKMIFSWADAANYALTDSVGFGVGRVFPQSGFSFTAGDLGPVRITKGVGRYIDDFIPAQFTPFGF